MRCGYAVTPEANGEGITATFDGLPGATGAGALAMAEDLLLSALGFYADDGKPLPGPGPALGRPVVWVLPLVVATLALHDVNVLAGFSQRLTRNETATVLPISSTHQAASAASARREKKMVA